MGKPVLVFANPTSGRGRGVRLAGALLPRLTSAGFVSAYWPDNPAAFADADAVVAAHAVIAIGGDGTLRAVIDRLLALVPADLPPVLCVGFGTANLMQRHLKLRYPKADPAGRVVDLLKAGRTKSVDIATAGGHAFLLMTSVGYDAGVVHRLAAGRTGPITKLSYLMPALMHLREQAYPAVTVTVDGQVVHEGGPAQVFVGNVAEYGTGFPILDEADSADGLLDVCVLPCGGHVQFAQLVLRIARGGHRAAAGVIYQRGRSVTITSASPLPVQIDGDPAGFTPVELRLLPRRATFIVP